jgi:hypothetical protein
MAPSPQPGLLLRLPHDVLVDLFVRLEARDIGRLAATCRLLQYGQSSPQAPNPVEHALRLQARLDGWSGTLPVNARGAVRYFLRLAWQGELEFHPISASQGLPTSFFVGAGGSLRACGVEMQHEKDTKDFLYYGDAAPAGSLGFGRDWHIDTGSVDLRKEGPALVPTTEGVRMRSVAVGEALSLALTDDGQMYMWGAVDARWGLPKFPTRFDEVSTLKMRRVAASTTHSAALTDVGKLYTRLHDKCAWQDERYALGAGYPLPDLIDIESAFYCPKCVESFVSMRIVSVAAGSLSMIVVTDNGMAFP